MNAATFVQLQAAEDSEKAMQARMTAQLALYEATQAEKHALMQRMEDLQVWMVQNY